MSLLESLMAWFSRPTPAAPVVPVAPMAVDDDPDWPRVLRAVEFADPDKWAAVIATPARRWKIHKGRRAAAFAATISHESTRGTALVENLNYSVAALTTMFGPHRGMTADLAARIGYRKNAAGGLVQRADQQAIANTVYGGPWGRENLGNTQPGDGWRFRGRGLIQLTGRDAYARAAAATGLPLVEQPEMAEQPVVAAEVACWAWADWKGCNELADADDIVAWRKRINGGTNGLKEVTALYNAAMSI